MCSVGEVRTLMGSELFKSPNSVTKTKDATPAVRHQRKLLPAQPLIDPTTINTVWTHCWYEAFLHVSLYTRGLEGSHRRPMRPEISQIRFVLNCLSRKCSKAPKWNLVSSLKVPLLVPVGSTWWHPKLNSNKRLSFLANYSWVQPT